MNPNALIRYRRDLYVASRNPFAARWSTLSPALYPLVLSAGAGPDATVRDQNEEEPDDTDTDDPDAGDEDLDEAEQTAEPEGQFPDAPDALNKDTERPGATQNRHGDRGGVS